MDTKGDAMPKWKKDAKEFTVTIHHNEASGYYTTSIPKPTVDHIGKGKQVDAITYRIRGTKVEISLPPT